MVLRLRHIPASAWVAATLLLALPGMFGEAVLLSSFSTFMPRLQPASAGRYGAFLFAAYASSSASRRWLPEGYAVI